MIFFGSIDAIETAAGWMALSAVPIAAAAAVGLALAALVRRDPASRHAILALALVAVCGSPFGVWFAHRAGWSFLALPWAISRPNPVAPVASTTDGHVHLAGASTSDRPVPRNVAETATRDSFSPMADMRSANFDASASDEQRPETAVGLSASQPAEGHRLLAFVPLAAVIGVATWAVGLIFVLVRMVHGWLAVRRICRDASPLDRDRFAGLTEGVKQRFRLRRPLQIVVSDLIGTAAALGGLDQQIILPTSYVAQLSPEELEAVLIHETAHLVRRDHRIALLQRLVAAVYWPHPLVHVLNRRLARAREECCDNYVLQQFDPRRYAQLLLRLAEWPAKWMPPAPTLAFFNRRWKLEDRIAGLLDARRRSEIRPRRPLVLVVSTVIAAIALASAGLRLTQASDKPATADGNQPSGSPAGQPTEGNPSHPAAPVTVKELVAAAGALPPPRRDLPGHASVQLGGSRFRTDASDLAFLPDGKTIVSASWDDGIKWWDIGSGKVKLRMRVKAARMLMSADRKRLVTQDTYDRQHNSLQIWNAADGNHVADVKWPLGDPLDFKILLALTPDGTAAILSGPDEQIVLRELATGRVLEQRGLSSSEIGGVAISPNGGLLAIGTFSNQLFLWEWRSANPPVELGPGQRYAGLAFSADGKHLAAGGDSKDEVRIFNVATHEIERRLTDPKGWPLLVDGLTFTPDGKRLAAANSIMLRDDFTAGILVWDVETGALKQRLTVSGAHPRRLALSADGNLLAAPMGETLHVWNLQTGQTVGGETTGHSAAVGAVCFSPKPGRIVTASDDGTARIWDAVTGRELHRLDHGGKLVRAAAVSPDGTLAATSGLDDKVCIWQMETGKQVHALQGHGPVGGWRALQFSPDGSLLGSWGDDKKLRVWDVATGKLKRAFALKRSGTRDADPAREKTLLPGHPEFDDMCSGACFQNGGSRLVQSAHDHYWVFDTATGREIDYERTKMPVSGLACSESGNQILIGSMAPFRSRQLSSGAWTSEAVGSASLRLIAGESGRPLWSTTINGIYVGPITLSPDGRLAAAGMDGPERTSIGIFDGKTGSLLRTIEGVERMRGGFREAAFSPDSRRLAVAQTDGTVLIWDLAWLGLKSVR